MREIQHCILPGDIHLSTDRTAGWGQVDVDAVGIPAKGRSSHV
jgi:hypothetical protein